MPKEILAGKKSKSAARAIAIVAAYEGLESAWDRGKEMYRKHLEYNVTIMDVNPAYDDIHRWVLDVIGADNARSLLVGAREEDYGIAASPDTSENVKLKPMPITFNDQKERPMVVDGHRVMVMVERPDRGVTNSSSYYQSDKIRFTMHTKAAQQAVIDAVQWIHLARNTEKKPMLRMIDQWGSWRNRSDLPPRPMDSVILPAEQKSRILNDIDQFLASEDRYNELAIPWHRGYLFHGPPGSGKTSLVKALASSLGLDLWYVSLSDLKAEYSLMGLLSNVSPRSMLLLEDIDTIQISHDRDTEQGAISMSSLLNALDGVATPHGLITVMTTNHIEVLDDALVRPGRMDLIEEIGLPTWREVAELYARYYQRPFNHAQNVLDEPAPPMAEVAELLKQHLDNPESAAYALADLRATQVLA